MSGRIRTIKPELLEDEKTASLGDFTFRVFIGLLLVADDYGNTRASAQFLHGQIAWGTEHDNKDLETALLSLEDLGIVFTYRVRGQSYIHITNWNKHQKVDKPGKPRVPGPNEPESSPEYNVVTYLVQIGDDGPIKIGRTIDLQARIKRLQTAVPHKLETRKVIQGNVEAELHRRFAHLRQTGEWFSPEVDLLTFIGENDSANLSRIVREPFAPDPDPDPDPDRRSGREHEGNQNDTESVAGANRSDPPSPTETEANQNSGSEGAGKNSVNDSADESPGSQTRKKATRQPKPDLPLTALSEREKAAYDAIMGDTDLAAITVRQTQLARDLCLAAPGVDLPLHIRRAGAWMRANPTKAKTKGNRFLLNWVSKEQDSGNVLPFSGNQRAQGGAFNNTSTNDTQEEAVGPYRRSQGYARPPEMTPEEARRRLAEFDAAGKEIFG